MTEEDQKLVALAALHGARFIRLREDDGDRMFWSCESHPMKKWTIGRAAEHYLFCNGLRSEKEHDEYQDRTDCYLDPQEVDEVFIASVLA